MKISAAKILFLLFLLMALAALPGPEAPAQSPAGQEEELETFVPTEKLPADSAISFPVDI